MRYKTSRKERIRREERRRCPEEVPAQLEIIAEMGEIDTGKQTASPDEGKEGCEGLER